MTIDYRELLKDCIRGQILDFDRIAEPCGGHPEELSEEKLRALSKCVDEVIEEMASLAALMNVNEGLISPDQIGTARAEKLEQMKTDLAIAAADRSAASVIGELLLIKPPN